LRKNNAWHRRLPETNLPAIRQRVGEHSPQDRKTSTAIDLALSEGAKRVLRYAASKPSGRPTGRSEPSTCFLACSTRNAALLSNFSIEAAADVASIRQQVAMAAAAKQSMPGIYEAIRTPSFGALSGAATLIHGVAGSADRIQERVERCRIYNWHWAKPRH
jgi:hypothetical protein